MYDEKVQRRQRTNKVAAATTQPSPIDNRNWINLINKINGNKNKTIILLLSGAVTKLNQHVVIETEAKLVVKNN